MPSKRGVTTGVLARTGFQVNLHLSSLSFRWKNAPYDHSSFPKSWFSVYRLMDGQSNTSQILWKWRRTVGEFVASCPWDNLDSTSMVFQYKFAAFRTQCGNSGIDICKQAYNLNIRQASGYKSIPHGIFLKAGFSWQPAILMSAHCSGFLILHLLQSHEVIGLAKIFEVRIPG